MIQNKNLSEIYNACYVDKKKAIEMSEVSWIKKNGIDLIVKYVILCINSIGKREKSNYIFVDEIKNNNMHNNLCETYDVFARKGENVKLLNFYSIGSSEHMHTGFMGNYAEIVTMSFFCVFIAMVSMVSNDSALQITVKILSRRFIKYLEDIDRSTGFYTMTDHHFFSSIIGMVRTMNCSVIQHGLLMNMSFYYPIRAHRFLCWGKRSKELLYNDPKAIVSGTYKFNSFRQTKSKSEIKNILFCIGSLDNEKVKKKIDVLLKYTKDYGYRLIVKCHPGSQFDDNQWKALYLNSGITFYKEELLKDLDFDLGISERSTAIMDLIALKKPFILFDEPGGYFDKYLESIPQASTGEELTNVISRLSSYDFDTIINTLYTEELNSGNCQIYQLRNG